MSYKPNTEASINDKSALKENCSIVKTEKRQEKNLVSNNLMKTSLKIMVVTRHLEVYNKTTNIEKQKIYSLVPNNDEKFVFLMLWVYSCAAKYESH